MIFLVDERNLDDHIPLPREGGRERDNAGIIISSW
jgi:hypothetical protein